MQALLIMRLPLFCSRGFPRRKMRNTQSVYRHAVATRKLQLTCTRCTGVRARRAEKRARPEHARAARTRVHVRAPRYIIVFGGVFALTGSGHL